MNRVIVFDVSETIDKYPENCRILIESLLKDGWEIVICSPNPIDTIHDDLQQACIDTDTVTIENTGHKGKVCDTYNAALFLDDNEGYLGQCKSESKNTMPLKVL